MWKYDMKRRHTLWEKKSKLRIIIIGPLEKVYLIRFDTIKYSFKIWIGLMDQLWTLLIWGLD